MQHPPVGRRAGHGHLSALSAELPSDPTGLRSDAELLTSTGSGDRDAYAELLRRHQPAGRLLLDSLQYSLLGSLPGDADWSAEGLLRAASDLVLDSIHAGTGPQAGFRPFYLRAVLRVAAPTSLGAGNVQRPDPLRPPADAALAQLTESAMTTLWHTAVEHDSPDRVAVLLGAGATHATVAGYRARAEFRQLYVRHLLGSLDGTPAECREIMEALGRFTFEGLYDDEAEVVTAHLSACATCADLRARLVAVDAAMPARLAGMVLGPHAPGYLDTLRRLGPPEFALVEPLDPAPSPRPAVAAWPDRVVASSRLVLAARHAVCGPGTGIAALGTLAAASVAALAWATVAMLGGTSPSTDADRTGVSGSTVGDTTVPEDDWIGILPASPTAPQTGLRAPTATRTAVPTAVPTANPAVRRARPEAVVRLGQPPRTQPAAPHRQRPTAQAPAPNHTVTSAPVPRPTPRPAPPPPDRSSPPPTSEPSPPAPPHLPKPTPTPEPPTTEPSPPPDGTLPPDS